MVHSDFGAHPLRSGCFHDRDPYDTRHGNGAESVYGCGYALRRDVCIFRGESGSDHFPDGRHLGSQGVGVRLVCGPPLLFGLWASYSVPYLPDFHALLTRWSGSPNFSSLNLPKLKNGFWQVEPDPLL